MNETHIISPREDRLNHFYIERKNIFKKSDRLLFWQYISICLSILSFSFLLTYFLLIFPSENQFYFFDQKTQIIITNQELYEKTITSLNLSNVDLIIHDNKYILPDLKMIQSFLKYDDTNQMEYKIDVNDCDNFSFILFGNFLKEQYKTLSKMDYSFLFGIAYGKSIESELDHTFNLFLDSKYDFYCMESQQDKIIPCYDYNKYQIYRIIF